MEDYTKEFFKSEEFENLLGDIYDIELLKYSHYNNNSHRVLFTLFQKNYDLYILKTHFDELRVHGFTNTLIQDKVGVTISGDVLLLIKNKIRARIKTLVKIRVLLLQEMKKMKKIQDESGNQMNVKNVKNVKCNTSYSLYPFVNKDNKNVVKDVKNLTIQEKINKQILYLI